MSKANYDVSQVANYTDIAGALRRDTAIRANEAAANKLLHKPKPTVKEARAAIDKYEENAKLEAELARTAKFPEVKQGHLRARSSYSNMASRLKNAIAEGEFAK